MQISPSDLLDRLSIVKLKLERLPSSNPVNNEFDALMEVAIEYFQNLELVRLYNNLYQVNGRIWDLEADIRQGKEKQLGLEEVGRRALAIRDLNKVRIDYKNEITELTQKGFKEIKINHAST